MYANENRIILAIDTTTSGDNTILAAPTDGSFYAIDFITLNPGGGANLTTLKNIQALADAVQNIVMDLNDNQPITFENAIHEPNGILRTKVNGAFVINLTAATRITGFMIYRIRNKG